jgi:hypothetical protein
MVIPTVDKNSRSQIRDSLLTVLASARAELAAIHVRAIQQLGAARSALELASLAGYGPTAVCHVGDDGAALTVAHLVDLAKRFESEETQTRELLARVDARLAEASLVASASRH